MNLLGVFTWFIFSVGILLAITWFQTLGAVIYHVYMPIYSLLHPRVCLLLFTFTLLGPSVPLT